MIVLAASDRILVELLPSREAMKNLSDKSLEMHPANLPSLNHAALTAF